MNMSYKLKLIQAKKTPEYISDFQFSRFHTAHYLELGQMLKLTFLENLPGFQFFDRL